MTQDHDGRPIRNVLFGPKLASDDRRHSENAEEARSDALLLDVSDLASGTEIQSAIHVAVNSEIDCFGDISKMFPRGAILCGLEASLILELGSHDQDGETVRVWIGQGTPQSGVDNAEN